MKKEGRTGGIRAVRWLPVLLLAALLLGWGVPRLLAARVESNTTFAMNTVLRQDVYGLNAQKALQAVERRIEELEDQWSLYDPESDLARLNDAAGVSFVDVSEDTYQLLKLGKELSTGVPDAFALTIAPLTLAWGITTDHPRVPTQEEIDALLPLVDDQSLLLENGRAMLAHEGQAIDLGGIAKGAACDAARQIYEQMGVESALLNLGGSTIYARGVKPDGTAFRVGFRDPAGEQSSAIASFTIQDAVFSTSGGYERYFEQDGVRYQHILNPATGWPAKSDILSVGVLAESGAQADFYSTALYVMGKEKALESMRAGVTAILMDEEGTLYVSPAFRDSLQLLTEELRVVYVE